MTGCCYYCSDSEEQRVHVLKPPITGFFFSLTKSVFTRCIRVRSWRLPDIQWIKLAELNVVGISAGWAACALACSILRRHPSTASALSACWPVPASNRRSPSSWAQRSKKLKASLFIVSPNDFKSICVCTSIILFPPLFFLFFSFSLRFHSNNNTFNMHLSLTQLWLTLKIQPSLSVAPMLRRCGTAAAAVTIQSLSLLPAVLNRVWILQGL